MTTKTYDSPELVDLGSITEITAEMGAVTQYDIGIDANGSEYTKAEGSMDSCDPYDDYDPCSSM